MSQDNQDQDPEDPTFDFEGYMEQADEEMTEQWPFELDDDGNIVQEPMGWDQKAKIYGTMALGHVIQFVYAVVFFYLLIAAVSFLMGLTGVAIPVQ